MHDLKNAILAVLEDAVDLNFQNGMLHLSNHHAVDSDLLILLACEYNIHFVEPDQEQLKL
jgi:hypothetical protein